MLQKFGVNIQKQLFFGGGRITTNHGNIQTDYLLSPVSYNMGRNLSIWVEPYSNWPLDRSLQNVSNILKMSTWRPYNFSAAIKLLTEGTLWTTTEDLSSTSFVGRSVSVQLRAPVAHCCPSWVRMYTSRLVIYNFQFGSPSSEIANWKFTDIEAYCLLLEHIRT